MSMKYLIVDDEPMAHQVIKKYCSMLPDMQLVHDCYDAIEALEFLRSHSVDLIFLDLNMPKLQGFEFLKTLPSPPRVIVTTAYQEYAWEGYELNIVDYLLKPFSFERFVKAVHKASMATVKAPEVRQYETGGAETRRIFLRSGSRHVQVLLEDILFIEASGNYVKVMLADEMITLRGTLSSVMELIPASGFIQVHRSFLVAQRHIKSIEGNQILISKYTVPIGKIYREQLDRLLK